MPRPSTAQPGTTKDKVRLVLMLLGFAAVFGLLAGFPLMQLIGYRGLRGDTLARKIGQALALYGVDAGDRETLLHEHNECNGLPAFFLPMLVNLLILVLVWAITAIPNGLKAVFDFMRSVPATARASGGCTRTWPLRPKRSLGPCSGPTSTASSS